MAASRQVKKWVTKYVEQGWYPIPLKFAAKDLKDRDGLDRVYSPDEFDETDNVGLRLISTKDKDRTVKLIALDFDAPEITPKVVWTFAPLTCGWGRESKPISQVLYVCPQDRSLVHKDLGHQDPKHQTLIEVRASHQSMCPPSVHPNSEVVKWLNARKFTEDASPATTASPSELRRSVDLIATYALIARYYPPAGARHYWGLYLAGFLQQLGITLEECTNLLTLAGEQVNDPELKDRLDAVRTTYARPDDDPVGGSQKLAEELGDERGQPFIQSLRKIWGASGTGFAMNRAQNRILASHLGNVQSAIRQLGVELSFDEFSQRVMIAHGGKKLILDDAAVIKVWFEVERRFSFRPSKDFFFDVLSNEARDNPFHPVCDYLDSLVWDQRPRIDEWLVRYGDADDSAYVRAVSKLVLLAAVRRVRKPGCKFDELLVLESGQGRNKSTALQALCPNPEWFSDDLPLGVDAKQMIERTAGRWIIEVSELIGSRRDTDHLKASLSRQVDGPVRMAYARIPVEQPRQFIMIGTVNPMQYLKDNTGNRRFWPVRVDKFDIKEIVKDRDQLWAEAAHLEGNGSSIRLKPELYKDASTQQEKRRAVDPWEDLCRDFIEEQPTRPLKRGRMGQRVTEEDLWNHIGLTRDKRDIGSGLRLSNILRSLGFSKCKVRGKNGKPASGWGRDAVGDVFVPPEIGPRGT